MAQVDGLLPRVIEQPAGRRDENVHAAPQRVHLGLHADAAVDERRTELEMLAVRAHVLVHLRGEFPRRRDDEDAHRTRSRALRQPLENGQREAGGLAGARLGGAEQIATAQDDRNGLRLDGGGLGVALLCDSAQQLGAQAETFE